MSEKLLPPAKELAKLTDAQTRAVLYAVDRSNHRQHSYAIIAMLCGTISFLCVAAGFTYLAMRGHTQAAGVLLGTAVLAIIGQMIYSRLRS